MSSSVPRSLVHGFAVAVATTLLAVALLATASSAHAAYNITSYDLAPSSTEAAEHPNLNQTLRPDAANADSTGGDDLKRIVTDLPAGMMLNPEAGKTKCVSTGSGTTNKFSSDTCPASSFVGTTSIKWRETNGNTGSADGSVYVLSAVTSGSAATLGVVLRPTGWKKIFIKAEIKYLALARPAADAAYGLSLTLDGLPRSLSPTSLGFSRSITISEFKLNLNQRAGGSSVLTPNGPYFVTNPTRCDDAKSRTVITSYGNVVATRNLSFLPTDCQGVPLSPGASVKPVSQTVGAATGFDAIFTVPTADATTQNSHIRDIRSDLARGTALNSSAITAKSLCSDSSFSSDKCSSYAKIGTATAALPILPAALSGDIYLITRGTSITFGVVLRGTNTAKYFLRGSLAPADVSGDGTPDLLRLSGTQLPQVPWSNAALRFTTSVIKNPTAVCSSSPAFSTFTGRSGASATVANDWFTNTAACVPETTITAKPPELGNSSSASFSFTSTITGATFVCRLDSDPFAACTSPRQLTNLTEGSHTFCVGAVNGGFADQSPACETFVVDTLPPTVSGSCNTADDAPTTNCSWTVDDPAATVTCQIDGAPLSPCTNPIVVSGVGSHNVNITATDQAGNSGTFSVNFTHVQPVQVAITSPPNNSWTASSTTNARYTVDGSTTIPAGTTCTVNGVPSTDSQVNSVSLAVGPNTITVICTNAFGSSAPATVTVNRDLNPPTISNVAVTPNNTPGPATLTYSSSDNSGQPVSCNPPSGSPIQLVTGANVITITCVDAAGNAASYSLSVTIGGGGSFTVTITSAPPAQTTDNTPTFTYSSSIPVWYMPPCPPGQYCIQIVEQVVAFNCTMDGASVGCGDSSYTSPPLPLGQHVFCVTGRYLPTGAYSNTACHAFTVIDQPSPPPVVAISEPANNSWTSQSSTNVRYTVNGGTTIPAGTTCTVNGSPSTNSQTNPVALASGGNTISATCTNASGPSAPSTITVNRDDVPPTISNVAVSPNNSPGPATLTYSSSDNSGQPVTCNPPSGSTIQLVTGTNVITITCVDVAGNAASYSASITVGGGGSFTVTITNGPPPVTSLTTPRFDYVSSIPVWYTPPCAPGTVCIQIAERVVAFDCTMDGGSVNCGDSSYTSPPLANGPHTFCVTGRYLPTGQLSNTDCYSFTVAGESWPPAVEVTSPANGSTTTSATTNVSYTVNGGTSIPAGTTCTLNGAPSTSATTNSVALVVGSNTITVACSDANGTGNAVVTITRAPIAGFGPTFTHSLSPATIGTAHRMNFGFTTPEGVEQVRRVQIDEDIKLQANFPGFGLPEDMCADITTIPFDASTCPDSSFIGTLQLVISGVTHIASGKIYLVDRSPLPRLAVDMKVSDVGGPASMNFQTFILLDLPQVDPTCDPLTQPDEFCRLRIRMTMDNLPNIGITGGYVALGRSGRVGVGGPIATEIFRTSLGGGACDPTMTTTATFTGWSGSTSAATDEDTLACP